MELGSESFSIQEYITNISMYIPSLRVQFVVAAKWIWTSRTKKASQYHRNIYHHWHSQHAWSLMNPLFFAYLPFKSTSSKKDDNLSNNIEEAETMDVAHASSIASQNQLFTLQTSRRS